MSPASRPDTERAGDAERTAVPAETDEKAARQLAATAAAPAPSHGEAVADPVTIDGGARLRALAEAAVRRTRPQPVAERAEKTERAERAERAERGDSLRARALARAAAAPSQEQRDLPLWTGSDLPAGAWRKEDGVLHDAYGVPQWRLRTAPGPRRLTEAPAGTVGLADPGAGAYEPVGLRQAFTSTVAQAWADIVPSEHGTVEDLLEAVDVPLRELEEQWRRTVPASEADDEQHMAPARTGLVPPRRDPEPVAAALRQTDTHAAALQSFPEWQRLQTVRGATAHLWNVLREQAGEYFGRLRTDLRVQGFWRTVSLRSAATVGQCAQALADRLRNGLRGDLPTAEALLKLSDAALAYSTPGIPGPDHTVPVSAPDAAANATVDAVRRLRTTLRTGAPVPYGAREEAARASREVAEAFQVWWETPMGRELTTSPEHPRVAAFRQAWQRLPAADLPDGPGTAAGPYGDVGRSALALVERAEAANAQRARVGLPARFAAADVDALRAVASLADHHGGRLAVTLPPGHMPRRTPGPQTTTPTPRTAAPTPPTLRVAATARPAPAFRGPG
ncbi:hypothetical protein ACIGO6_37570 [Streptomyces sp. NPDC053750]|uniref:hypothetical protein n=1 Tax=Streptomyces sp. NPDC053750 TaxID=3365714 RepID=UPI0037D72164